MGQSTQQQRSNWKQFECHDDRLIRIAFGPDEISVAPPTKDAWLALASVMRVHGYKIRPADTSSYSCREITGGSGRSLHSFGIALDVNANTNGFIFTPDNRSVRFSDKATQEERAKDQRLRIADTDMTKAMIDDVLKIKTQNGQVVFDWGGLWKDRKDAMHFEIDVTPADLATGIDWSTVQGAPNGAPDFVALENGTPAPISTPPAFAGELGVFEKCCPVVEKWEGHFVNDPDDPGGPTNMGVTQATLARWRNRSVSVQEVQDLTRDEARQIFREHYWKPIQGDSLPLPAAQLCYDAGILTGVRTGARRLQEALVQQGKSIEVDGRIGPATIAAATSADIKRLVSDFAAAHEQYLRGRPGFPKYGKGWLNRLNDVRQVAMAMASAPASSTAHTAEPRPALNGGGTMTSEEIKRVIEIVLAQQAAANTGSSVVSPPAGATTPSPSTVPVLSPIDKALGGEALAGKKTMLAVVAYVLLSILQSQGVIGTATGNPATPTPAVTAPAPAPAAPVTTGAGAPVAPAPAPIQVVTASPPPGTKTPTGEILTILIGAFGGLGLLGKFDRLLQIASIAAKAAKKS